MEDNKSQLQKLKKNEKKTGRTIKIIVPVKAGTRKIFPAVFSSFKIFDKFFTT